MCGDLWLDDGGNRIYTKCGNTFKSTGLQETDMTYSGKINLTQVDSYDHYQIRSLSDFPTHNEIALIEYKDDSIDSYITKLRTYYHDFYNEIAEVALPTEWVNSKPYLNEPQFVFYTSDGRKIVVSKVQGIPTATSNILEIQ